jgi:hypothetical protein
MAMSASVMMGLTRMDGSSTSTGLSSSLMLTGIPLPGASGAFLEFPLIAKQQVEVAVVPFGRVGGPGAFNAGGTVFRPTPRLVWFIQPRPCSATSAPSGLASKLLGVAIAVGFADRVATSGQRHGFLVVHGHAGKGFTHLRAVFNGSGVPFTPSGFT